MIWKLTIEYDGSGFAGWGAQPGLRSIQGELEDAISQILGGTTRVALTVAGRTDAGVHATAQVASFELDREPPDRLAHRLNGVLPRQISVLKAEPAPEGFDARRWASSRSYRYRLLVTPHRRPLEEGRALWWPRPLDREALEACADAIDGKHDFTAFTPKQTEHVRFDRVVSVSRWVDESPVILAYEIRADAFMRSMIRVLVGTMLEVAAGRRSSDDVRALLEGAPRERAGETAPAHGLYFTGVEFGDGPAFVHASE